MIDVGGLLGFTVPRAEDPPPRDGAAILDDRIEQREHIEVNYNDVLAEQCRRSFARYAREQWQHTQLGSVRLEWGPHIEAICTHIQGQLEDAAAKRADPSFVMRAQNLLINCPPRCLKTILLTFANAWAWIRWPWLEILYLSSTPSVVLDSARLFRDVVGGTWYQTMFIRGAWKIRDDQDALSSMGNTAGGARRAKGFEAKVLGSNAGWLCIDDAHAMDDSVDAIKSACEHYDLNLSSRMNDPRTGIRTAIMQRASRGDFSDHVLLQGWFHLRMPMEYESKPECGCPQCTLGPTRTPNAFGWIDWRTEDGEILHERFTREFLAERLVVLRPHGYAGQMQQRPSPKGGNQFKVEMWRFAQIEGLELKGPRPHGARTGPAALVLTRVSGSGDIPGRLDVDWVSLTVDATGGSTSETASALGLVGIVGKAERRIILADYTPGPRTWLHTMNDIKKSVVSLANLTGWETKICVLVEKKALGEAAIEQLGEAVADGTLIDRWGRVIHAIIKPYEPTGKGDKEQRAEVLEPMMDTGLFYLLDGAEWLCTPPKGSLTTLVDEFGAFPKGQRDDRIDCVSQCVDKYRRKAVAWVGLFSGNQEPAMVQSAPAEPRVCAHRWVDGICADCKVVAAAR